MADIFSTDFGISGLTSITRQQKGSKTIEKYVSKILSKIRAKHYDNAKVDVINVLRVYPGLLPSLDTFVFDNGEKRYILDN